LNYIPKKNIPHITFRQRRVETRHLHIPKNVYEDRIEQFTKRITAILDYAMGTSTCRSKYLLAYFGEKATDCDHCDVCISDRRGKDYLVLADRFLRILSDGQAHLPTDFNYDGFSDVARKKAIEWLISEEKVIFKDGTFRLR
ncbi:MAG: RecQ family zinc-binding domain-containing protein, partial [Bacteroidaceae bacterium]|nr:RecQ family zinc-binding domain-containing protein [Bacteroidaceae bacterium]